MNRALKETYTLKDLTQKDLIADLYERYGKKLYAYAVYSWKVDEDTAWDLAYKTLYKVIDSHKKYEFESEEKFASFVFKIFINYLRNNYRDKKKLQAEMPLSDIDSSLLHERPDNAKDVNNNRKLAVLNQELDKMEDWQRMLLLMKSEGRSYSEIAGFIDKPEDNLRVYYQRLKEQITKKINERL
ncbi:MAG: sigma-70 family RNA polymerase sigma factor [Bacteroidota bacterium]